MEKSVWRTSGHGSSPLEGDESEERNRASFPRRGKLRVISYHFAELDLEIMEKRMLPAGKLLKFERSSLCEGKLDVPDKCFESQRTFQVR